MRELHRNAAIRIHQLGTKYLLPPNIIVCDKYKCYKNMMEELGYYGFKYQKKPKSVAEVLKAVLQEAVHQRAVLQRLLSRVQQRVLKAEHHRVQLRRIQQEKIHRQ